jgi:xanthine dehydrogenase accessory factor
MSIYRSLLSSLTEGTKAVMLTSVVRNSDQEVLVEKSYYTEQQVNDLEFQRQFPKHICQAIIRALDSGELQIIDDQEQRTDIIEPFFPQEKLIVFGGGHIAKPLVEFAVKLGFSVTAVDDRPSFANKERFPDADQVICESFERCFNLLTFNPYTYAVIVTRGHRHDLDCLRAVIQRQWAYAGMIGSRKRVKGIKDQLRAEGYAQELLDKVNAPIGLEIGAVTPEEIAVSIIAQVIAYRRLREPALGRESSKISWTEFDRDVIEELSEGKPNQKALVTVVSTKGSAPRRAGAKMLVWPDGKILGSVGGGCGEGLIIRTALDIISTGGCTFQNIDLTAEIAEEDGMVCGGMMKVFIESL